MDFEGWIGAAGKNSEPEIESYVAAQMKRPDLWHTKSGKWLELGQKQDGSYSFTTREPSKNDWELQTECFSRHKDGEMILTRGKSGRSAPFSPPGE